MARGYAKNPCLWDYTSFVQMSMLQTKTRYTLEEKEEEKRARMYRRWEIQKKSGKKKKKRKTGRKQERNKEEKARLMIKILPN